jgi:nucleoside-diphosphate-sugar epimerase
VTGGAGFIGSNICKRLVADGCFVRVVDNLLTESEATWGHHGQDRLRRGGHGRSEVARAVVKGIDVVLHEGALPSFPAAWTSRI